MNDSDKLQAICADREAHRAEIVAEKSDTMHLLFAFLAFAAGAAGVYWDDTIIKDPITRSWLLFAAAQIEFVLALFWLQLFVDMETHSAYVATLERKINELVGEPVATWESGLIRSYYATPRSAAFRNGIVLTVMFVVLFLGLMGMAAIRAKSVLPVAILVIEVAVYAFSAIAAIKEPIRVARIAEEFIPLRSERTPNQASGGDVQ